MGLGWPDFHIPVASRYATVLPDHWAQELEPDEVLVRIPDGKGGYRFHEGKCLLAKMPCYLPQDLLFKRAVGGARAKKIEQKVGVGLLCLLGGWRGSGLDHDGDKVWVVWDPTVIDGIPEEKWSQPSTVLEPQQFESLPGKVEALVSRSPNLSACAVGNGRHG